MLHRVARESQADHLIDLALLVRELNVGAPCGQVGAALLPETILRRDDKAGVVAFLAKRAHQLARHHEVSAFRKRRTRGDDANRGHYWPSPYVGINRTITPRKRLSFAPFSNIGTKPVDEEIVTK